MDMKKTGFLTLLLLSLLLLPSCERNDYQEWKMLNDQWWEQHKNDSGYTTSASGLMYKIIEQGEQRFPNDYSRIWVTYTGKFIDGTVFEKQTKPIPLSMMTVVPGWVEGLKKIENGGIIHMYVPSSLGYGSKGKGFIPPYSALIFEIHLIASSY